MNLEELKFKPYSMEEVLQKRKELTIDSQNDLIHYINHRLVKENSMSQIEIEIEKDRLSNLDLMDLHNVVQLYLQAGWANIRTVCPNSLSDEEEFRTALIFIPHTEESRARHISQLQEEMKNITTTIKSIKDNPFIVRILVEKRNELAKAIENIYVFPIQTGDLVKRNLDHHEDPQSWVRGIVTELYPKISVMGEIDYVFLVQWQNEEKLMCDEKMVTKL